MTIHKFRNSGDAYDECQCNEEIKDGDILVIESELVCGVAWTWPIAVTKCAGALHRVASREAVSRVGSCEWHTAEQNERTMSALQSGFRAAVAEAIQRGWALDPSFEDDEDDEDDHGGLGSSEPWNPTGDRKFE